MDTFVPIVTGILGEQILKSAAIKVKQQKSNLQVTTVEQSKIKINSSIPEVPYDQMFPFLLPEIHPDKVNVLQAIFDKHKVCYPQTGFTIISFPPLFCVKINLSLWCKALQYY
ncbi:hypothetical protein QL285_002345 [Trifolium repens]|nr:hypothetical protein QL285_002345 [Trifolium repens]